MERQWSRFVRVALSVAAMVAVSVNAALATDDGGSADVVHFPVASSQPNPLELLGYLRRPGGAGPFPAVVLLHGCGGDPRGLDRNWGSRFQLWGYVSLTVDSFSPRGITNSCHNGEPTSRNLDPYAALQYLAERTFVTSSRMAIMGFSAGGIVALNDIEPREGVEPVALKFHAAIAIYPICAGSGIVSVPTLVLNGQLDDWSSAEACQKMVAQESDIGVTRHKSVSAPISLVILRGAYHKFDDPKFQPGRRYMGHMLEYNADALTHAAEDVHNFLRAQLGPR